MKLCGRCQTSKPLTEFHKRGSGHQPWCRDCKLVYDRRYYVDNKDKIDSKNRDQRARKQIWYRGLKSNPCTDCGIQYPYYVMQWDHVTGEKSGNLGDLFQFSRRVILEEIAKCELVCANCHAVRTYQRAQGDTAP